MILVCLLACTLAGFLIGAVVGVVLGKDLAIAYEEKKKEPNLITGVVGFPDWREDLDDPEGEWK